MKFLFSNKRDIINRMDPQIKKYYEDLEVKNAILEKEVIYLELNYKKSQLMALLSKNQSTENKVSKKTVNKKDQKVREDIKRPDIKENSKTVEDFPIMED